MGAPSLVQPHGGRLVERTHAVPHGLERLEPVVLSDDELVDLDMLACGALSPLDGFMGRADYERVLEEMRLANGLPWPVPVCLAVEDLPRGDRVALCDASRVPYAVLDVDDVFVYDRDREAMRFLGTADASDPAVGVLRRRPPLYLAGPVSVFRRRRPRFAAHARDPGATRNAILDRGWTRTVGHETGDILTEREERAVEEALKWADGLLLRIRDSAPAAPREIEAALRRGSRGHGLPPARMLLCSFPARRLALAARDAILRAILCRNYGCSHVLVGTNPARSLVGDEPLDVVGAFDRFGAEELGVEPVFFDDPDRRSVGAGSRPAGRARFRPLRP